MTRANLQVTSASNRVFIHDISSSVHLWSIKVTSCSNYSIKNQLHQRSHPRVFTLCLFLANTYYILFPIMYHIHPINQESPISKSHTSATDSGSERASSCVNQSPRHSWTEDWIKNDLQEFYQSYTQPICFLKIRTGTNQPPAQGRGRWRGWRWQ